MRPRVDRRALALAMAALAVAYLVWAYLAPWLLGLIGLGDFDMLGRVVLVFVTLSALEAVLSRTTAPPPAFPRPASPSQP